MTLPPFPHARPARSRRLEAGGQRVPQGRCGVPATLRGEDDPSLRPPMGHLSDGRRQGGRNRCVTSGQGEPRLHRASSILGSGAREVRLRVANLPKELLAALRDHNTDLTVLAVCHLLFIDSLRRISKGSVETATASVFPAWIEFVEQHPAARSLAPTQMGICGSSPASIEPLGPSFLPDEPIDKTETGPHSSPAWYAVDSLALRQSFASFEQYAELLKSRPAIANRRGGVGLRRGASDPRLSPLADGLARHHPERREKDDDRRHLPVCRGRGQILAHVSLCHRSTGSHPVGVPQLVRIRLRRTSKDQRSQL